MSKDQLCPGLVFGLGPQYTSAIHKNKQQWFKKVLHEKQQSICSINYLTFLIRVISAASSLPFTRTSVL